MVNLFKIRNLVEKQKITIRDLSKQVGITEQGLQKLIRQNSTKTDTLEKIAGVLKVPVSYFFEETETNVSIKMEHNGNGHNIAGKEVSLSECIKEIEHLTEVIKLKNEIIGELRRGKKE